MRALWARTWAAQTRSRPIMRPARGDVLTRMLGVDLLNRSLLTDFLPAQALRGVGLHLLANIGAAAPSRHARRAGRRRVPLPRLMQPGALR